MVKLLNFVPRLRPTQNTTSTQITTWQATVLSPNGRRTQSNLSSDLLPNGVRPLCSCAQCNAIRDQEIQSRSQPQIPYHLPPLHSHL